MFEIVIGAVIGTVVSVAIAEIYHRKASKGTLKELDKLSSLNKQISSTLEDAITVIGHSAEDTKVIKKHAVLGTPDDPEFPYK